MGIFANLSDLVKDLVPDKENTQPGEAGARLLLELVQSYERNQIYWAEFMIAAQAMQHAGETACESIQRINQAASASGAMVLHPKYFAAQDEAREKEFAELKT